MMNDSLNSIEKPSIIALLSEILRRIKNVETLLLQLTKRVQQLENP